MHFQRSRCSSICQARGFSVISADYSVNKTVYAEIVRKYAAPLVINVDAVIETCDLAERSYRADTLRRRASDLEFTAMGEEDKETVVKMFTYVKYDLCIVQEGRKKCREANGGANP